MPALSRIAGRSRHQMADENNVGFSRSESGCSCDSLRSHPGRTMKITKTTSNNAPIILIYGAEGRGKSTLACKFPHPLALLLERGLPRGVSVDAVEDINSFDAVMATLRDIYIAPGEYKSLLIDTVDALEAQLIEGLCAKNNWKNI